MFILSKEIIEKVLFHFEYDDLDDLKRILEKNKIKYPDELTSFGYNTLLEMTEQSMKQFDDPEYLTHPDM